MRPVFLILTALAAPALAHAQGSPAPSAATDTVTTTYQAGRPPSPLLPPVALAPADAPRARRLLIDGIALLLAERRGDAADRFRAVIALAASPADRAELARGGDGADAVRSRWFQAHRRTLSSPTEDRTHWAQLLAASSLSVVATDPTSPFATETAVRDMWWLVSARAEAGKPGEVAALLAPVFAATNPDYEIALARRATASSDAVLPVMIELFDRPERRAEAAVRDLYRTRAERLYDAGDRSGASAALARARIAGELPGDLEIAMLFAQGEIANAIAAIRDADGTPPDGVLSLTAVARLFDIARLNGGREIPPSAIYRLISDTLKAPKHAGVTVIPSKHGLLAGVVPSIGWMLAEALLAEGHLAQAETILLEQFDRTRGLAQFDPQAVIAALRLGRALEALARNEEAELIYLRLWNMCLDDACFGQRPVDFATGIVRTRIARAQFDRAQQFAADALARARAKKAEDLSGTFDLITTLTLYAIALEATEKGALAEGALREAIALDPMPGRPAMTGHGFHPPEDARIQLAALLERSHRAAEAEPIRRRMVALALAGDSNPAEGGLRRKAAIALARNLALQRKAEGARQFETRVAQVDLIYGTHSPQSVDVNEAYARAMMDAGRPAQALAPARRALATRTTSRYLTVSAPITDAGRQQSSRLTVAARLVIRSAWETAAPR